MSESETPLANASARAPVTSTIMIVDDTPANLQLLHQMLEAQRYRVIVFPSGQRALDAARRNPPDLILLDITMPEMDGFEVCAQLKADHALKEIPVIFLSALIEMEEKVRAFAVGGADYISKPFQVEEVLARVRTHLNNASLKKELMAARDTAEEALRAKSAFFAMLSHEIRTPMNGVLGLAELLLESRLSPEQRESVETIHHSGGLLLSLINDILDYSKLESRVLELEQRPLELRRMAEHALSVLRPKAKEKGLELKLEFDGGADAPLLGDELRLNQVILNLLSNAVKFTMQGSVTLRVQTKDETSDQRKVRVEVADTGIGIKLENQERLFREFSQADSSITRRFGGTGLGLAICRKLILAMDGLIQMRSEPGQGSVFWFEVELPLASAPLSLVTEDSTEQQPKALRILVAEDNPVNQLVMKKMLVSMGHVVSVVEDGEKAIAQLEAQGYDLVLMDISMPVMDGLETTRRIRSRADALATIPIVAVSASTEKEEMTACLLAGVNDCLTKPISKDSLKKILKKYR